MPTPALYTRTGADDVHCPYEGKGARGAGRARAPAIAALAMPAAPRGNFEIQVTARTPWRGRLDGGPALQRRRRGSTQNDHILRTQGAFHETLEVTQGWTSWLETGFYVFTSIQPDTTWEWVGNHIRPRVRVPESWELPVGLSLSAEVGYQRRAFSADTWTLELRPIIDKQWRRWYVSINPTLDRAIKGESVTAARVLPRRQGQLQRDAQGGRRARVLRITRPGD